MTARSSTLATRKLRRPCAIQRRNSLVQLHHELVKPIALHYSRCSREGLDDLVQVGLLGLIRAAELYQVRQGTPFPAFARPHIRGAILHHLRDLAPTVRLPRRQAELQEKLVRLERQCQGEGRRINPEDLQRQLGIDPCQWSLLLRQRQLNRPASLAELPLEVLESAVAQEKPDAEAGQENGEADVQSLLARLECRQQEVVRQVVLGGVSYRQLARTLAVSPMTVQRLLHRGLEQLRQGLEEGGPTGRPMAGPFRSAAPGC
jgi:RNA polymerase sigma-B factor